MFSHLERPKLALAGPRQIFADFGATYLAHGFIGWLFAATAPVAIILSVGARGGLSESELASWIFGVFCVNGAITTLFSWLYRQPLAFFWTIPGTVLVGASLNHLSYAEVVGAYYVTGLLMVVLGATGWVRPAMRAIPMPIVMGMVAGVFLRFGVDLVKATHTDVAIAAPMVVIWLLLNIRAHIARVIPPVLAALVVGAAVALALGRIDTANLGAFALVRPVLQTPSWSLAALTELVIPLAITVLVVQNGQGYAVLNSAGHEPPVDSVTLACGVGSIFAALVGAVSTCLAGPTNAILISSGERPRHYIAALCTGLLSIGFGLMAPTLTRFMLIAPKSYISVLAGLAMLRVLQAAFVASFKERFTLGALVSFIVTVADLPLLNIGAAFWGLIAGLAMSWLLERADFKTLKAAA